MRISHCRHQHHRQHWPPSIESSAIVCACACNRACECARHSFVKPIKEALVLFIQYIICASLPLLSVGCIQILNQPRLKPSLLTRVLFICEPIHFRWMEKRVNIKMIKGTLPFCAEKRKGRHGNWWVNAPGEIKNKKTKKKKKNRHEE